MIRVRRVVHPSDFSPASAAAFTYAVDAAREGRGELLVVHVMVPVAPLLADGYVSPQAYDQLEKGARADATRRLGALVSRGKKAGVRASGLLLEGIAWDEIVRVARRKRADLIVMGTHGRGGLARLFLGSVATRVIASATCPVLTVRGRRAR
jgi:nucleotide-binding universal stress UspA family protein